MGEYGHEVYNITGMIEEEIFNTDNPLQASIDCLNPQYKEDISDIQKEIEYKKYNKLGTDAVRLNHDSRIFIIDHSNHKEYEDNREQGSPGFGIRAVYDLKDINANDIKEIIRITASDHNYSAGRIYRLLQNLGIEEGHYSSINIDAELKRIIASNTKLYGRNRKKWPTGGYGHRGQNNNDGKSSFRIKGSLGQETSDVTHHFKTSKGEVYGFLDTNNNIGLDFSIISAEHPIHEYTHFWDKIVQVRNPELWNKGVEIQHLYSCFMIL